MEFLVFAFLFGFFLGLIPANIAHATGRSFLAWWFYGWMLFPVALIHALTLPLEALSKIVEEQRKQTRLLTALAEGKNQ